MGYVLRGMRMVFNEPRLRPFLWKPWVTSLIIFLAVLVLGFALWVPVAAGLATSLGLPGWLGAGLGAVLYGLLWWFAAGVVFLFFAGILSSLLWDRLSAEVESLAGVSNSRTPPGCGLQLWDTLLRLPFTFLIAAATLIVGWTCLGLTGVLLAGWLSLYDYTACAYVRRHILFSRQFFRVFRNPSWPGFALASGLITLLPFVNVLLMPALVAAGTLLCADAEHDRRHSPAASPIEH